MNEGILYKREKYLKNIRGFYDATDLIKVITGVRRCGKSSLMQVIASEIKEKNNVKDENIVFLNLDLKEYLKIKTPEQLEKLIDEKTKNNEKTYLFIDEIQNVKNFEEIINAYRETGKYSIFITGSNSYLLSGELITKLTGRYLQFEIFPLDFEEYINMKKFYGKAVNSNLTEELESYINEGGFPRTIFIDNLKEKRTYIKNVIEEILEKDIKRRVKIKNVDAFARVQQYIINNFGATMSTNNIIEDLRKNGMTIKVETLRKYIQIMVDAKILYECKRFDLKSRKSIKGEQKYYLSDLSFYFSTNTDNRINYGPILENIVYIYCKSYNYEVSIGRIGNLECDFILRNQDMNYSYVQVAMTIMLNKETEDREYAPLEKIQDNYDKYVLTLNDFIQKRNGIIHKNIPELMANGEQF